MGRAVHAARAEGGAAESELKILLLAGVDLSRPGGLETHVLELARCFTARGHDVSVFGRPASLPPLRMVASVEPRGYDIVHHHGGRWPRSLDPGPGYGRTFHFSVAAKMEAYVRAGRLRTLLNPANYQALGEERRATRRRGFLIAVSESLRRELARFHHVAPDRVRVIPNGGRFELPREGRGAWRARHGIGNSAPVLLTIGRRDHVKGFDLIERVWSSPGAVPKSAVWVTVGGDRPARGPTRIVTGPIPAPDVTEWIHAADLGAFPSYYEGGGIALLDMLAGGLFTLAHGVGVAPDVIRPGVNGEIMARSRGAWIEALGRLLASPPPRVAAGLPGSYRWDAVAARVEAAYREQPAG